MDNYLASADLAHSECFYFNISFEFLKGCQFKCKGCFVDVMGASPMTDQYYSDLKKLLDSTSEGLYKPFIAFINPTDFLVADNTIEVLSDPRVIDILGRFKRLSFLSTFLNYRKAEEIGKVLREHYGHMELEINILIEPEHITNNKYLSVLKNNQKKTIEILNWHEPIRNFGIMNVYDFSKTRMAKVLSDYDLMNSAVNDLFETTIDFNFSIGRKGEELSNEEFVKAGGQIRDLFNDAIVDGDRGQYLRFSFGNQNDSLIERQYNWHQGKLYLSPLFYERYAAFIPELEVPLKDFSVLELEDFEQEVELLQYSNLHTKDECADCDFLSNCVDRQILHLMDIYNVSECMVAKESIRQLNHRGLMENGSS